MSGERRGRPAAPSPGRVRRGVGPARGPLGRDCSGRPRPGAEAGTCKTRSRGGRGERGRRSTAGGEERVALLQKRPRARWRVAAGLPSGNGKAPARVGEGRHSRLHFLLSLQPLPLILLGVCVRVCVSVCARACQS